LFLIELLHIFVVHLLSVEVKKAFFSNAWN